MVLALQFSSPLYFETSPLLHAAKEALLLLTARPMSWRGREGLRQVFMYLSKLETHNIYDAMMWEVEHIVNAVLTSELDKKQKISQRKGWKNKLNPQIIY